MSSKKALYVTRHVSPWSLSDAVRAGLTRLGYATNHVAVGIAPNCLDGVSLLVSSGWKPPQDYINLYREAFGRGIPAIAISDGYIQRSADAIPRYSSGYWAVSFNGLNSYTLNKIHDCSPDRFDALGVKLKPWRHDGSVIVVAHQHRADWLGRPRHAHFIRILDAASETGRPIRLRGHPNHWKANTDFGFGKYKVERTQARRHTAPIADDLHDAFCLVTHDSNAAVDAAIDGVPFFTIGRTMANAIVSPGLDLERRYFAPDDDRRRWANWIAWQQWTKDEIRTGKPFAYVLERACDYDEETMAVKDY